MDRSERVVNPNDTGFERRRLQEGTPMARYGRSDEIGETVAFLLSGRVPYITGAFFRSIVENDTTICHFANYLA
jgi:NAD(P)-dependent dehydrogenase (short-subunit alcohol dehydrogenase family)